VRTTHPDYKVGKAYERSRHLVADVCLEPIDRGAGTFSRGQAAGQQAHRPDFDASDGAFTGGCIEELGCHR
jgi:hypothetical protein